MKKFYAPSNPISLRPQSFYHRYTSLAANTDGREPLPTAWAFRYLGAGIPDIGTDVRVWKGSSNYDWTYDIERTGAVEVQPLGEGGRDVHGLLASHRIKNEQLFIHGHFFVDGDQFVHQCFIYM